MKQTNPSSALRVTVSLGILGLNEDFVQMNEIMNLIKLKISICRKNNFPIFLKELLPN